MKKVLILIVFFVQFIAYPQWRLDQISGAQGLSQNTIKSILQDQNGFIWVGTYNGINKYDGYEMTHYNFSDEKNRLSSNLIHNLFEDSKGNIWAGTSDAGINRINPHTGEIKTYFNTSATRDYYRNIKNLFETPSGAIFYNARDELRFFEVSEEGELLYDQRFRGLEEVKIPIRKIEKAAVDGYWLLTPLSQSKIVLMQVSDNNSEVDINIQTTGITNQLFENGYATNFIEYKKNSFLVISNFLELVEIIIDDNFQVISKKQIDLAAYLNLPNRKIFPQISMAVDKNENLWIGGDRLLVNYNIETGEVLDLGKHQYLKIKNKLIQNMMVDQSNILWLGTLYNGLFKIDLENNTFFNSEEFLKVNERLNKTFHQYPLMAIEEDSEGIIWMGAQANGGLATIKRSIVENTLDQKTSEVWEVDYLNKHRVFRDQVFFNIRRIFNDSKDNLWVGSSNGLSRITKSNTSSGYKLRKFRNIQNSDGKVIEDAVFSINEDYLGNMWIGYWGGGLVKISQNENRKNFNFAHYHFNSRDTLSISNNFIRDIFEDTNNDLWIGTVGGLNKLIRLPDGGHQFQQYLNEPDNSNSLSNNHVLDIYQSKGGKFYIGTFGGGLNEIKIEEDGVLQFKHFTVKNGLPSDVVYQITEDDEGYIWMMHVREISRLNPQTGEVVYFDKQDGFNIPEFKDNAVLKTSDGTMLFGGVNGFTFFDPKNLSVNTYSPQLNFTDFKLFDVSVQPFEEVNGTQVLTKSINDTKEIVLPYDQNSFEFVFSSLHFANSDKNQYRFILEGFEDKWQESKGNERRFASYTNVPPGDYTFKVLASNSAGVWTETPKEIQVIINHPWYTTVWAIMIFALAIAGILYLIGKVKLNQERLKSRLELESAVHEKSVEMNQMKLQFFTNISHELRTPLTLILGPLQQIMQGNVRKDEVAKLNAIMYKNSNRLLKLINQLLDFRKAESGNLNLLVQQGELVSFVQEVYRAFEDVAQEKEIKFLFVTNVDELNAWFDADKVEKMLYNLLSNAFKFTPKGKTIKVMISRDLVDNQPMATITVEDFGIGIPKEELESIFKRFYQAKKGAHNSDEGSGLGLAYINRLAEIHKGTIQIESEQHQGTKCTIQIPVDQEAYGVESIVETQSNQHQFKYTKLGVEVIKDQLIPRTTPSNNKEFGEETPMVLIVEDNKELQTYLTTFFSNYYRVAAANNGKEGLKMAREVLPSIIISDLMMPEMDGIEMCKIIKNDVTTSHIPVLILTAKAGLENEKEGLETGADEFVLKPFNIEVLRLRVENILRTKKQWVKKFQTTSDKKSWKELSNKLDQEFLEKSIGIVKKNIDNTEFSVEKFALEIGMSRSALFKKLKSITGQSTSEFIRTVRIKRAAKLIRSGKYSITEVIYLIGFSDPKYFRTCFKKQYGTTPSDYLNSFKKGAQAH